MTLNVFIAVLLNLESFFVIKPSQSISNILFSLSKKALCVVRSNLRLIFFNVIGLQMNRL